MLLAALCLTLMESNKSGYQSTLLKAMAVELARLDRKDLSDAVVCRYLVFEHARQFSNVEADLLRPAFTEEITGKSGSIIRKRYSGADWNIEDWMEATGIDAEDFCIAYLLRDIDDGFDQGEGRDQDLSDHITVADYQEMEELLCRHLFRPGELTLNDQIFPLVTPVHAFLKKADNLIAAGNPLDALPPLILAVGSIHAMDGIEKGDHHDLILYAGVVLARLACVDLRHSSSANTGEAEEPDAGSDNMG